LATPEQVVRFLSHRWKRDRRPDAATALVRYPQLRDDPIACVDLAFAEFWVRSENGEQLDLNEYCARFPDIEQSLHLSIKAALAAYKDLEKSRPASIYIASDDESLPWPKPGDFCCEVEILRELGRGAFARVYLGAEHFVGGRPVVLKLSAE